VLDLAELFYHSPDIGILTDRGGRILAASRELERRLGYEPGALEGLDLAALADGSLLRDFFAEGASASSRLRAPFHLRDRSGGLHAVDGLAFALRNGAGEAVGWFIAGLTLQGSVAEARQTRGVLDALIDSVGAMVWSFGRGGTVLTWSAECERYFGFARQEAEGHLAAARLFAFPEALERALAEADAKGRFSGEVLLTAKEGDIRTAHLSLTRLGEDAPGAPLGYTCVAFDITERKRTEQFHRSLFERVGEAILVVDADSTQILDANARASEILGYGREELLELRIPDLVPPGDRARVAVVGRALQASGRYEAKLDPYRRKDGSVILCEHTLRLITVGGRRYVLGILRDATRQVADERELREAKAFLEHMQEESRDGLCLLDGEGTLVWCNRAYAELVGIPREELAGRDFRDHVEPEIREGQGAAFRRVLEGEPARLRTIVVRRGGERRTAEVSALRVERQGRPMVFSSLRDVTQQVEAEEALRRAHEDLERRVEERTADLRRSEERFRLIAETMPVAMATTRLDGTIVFVNDAGAAVMRVPRAELPGRNIGDFYADAADRPRLREALFRDRGVTNWEFKLRRGDGSLGWGLTSLRMTEHGGEPAIIGCFQDLSALKEAEEALRLSESRFRNAFEHLGIGACIVSPEGRFLKVNRALCDMLGFPEGELLGKPCATVAHPEDVEDTVVAERRLLEGQESPVRLEKRYLRRDGGLVYGILTMTLLRDAAGRPVHFVCGIQDITDMKRAEAALREAHDVLERRVEERTALLSEEIAQRRRADEHLKLYREIFRNAREAIVIMGRDGRILEQNDAHRQLLGYSDEEIRGLSPSSIAVDGFPRALLAIENVGFFQGEVAVRSREGRLIDVDLSAFPVRNAAGELLCIVAIKRDITARKRSEEALRESEDRWRSLVSNAPGIIMTVDRAGTILSINRTVEGYRVEDVVGTSIYEYALPESQEVMRKAVESVFATGQPTSYELHGAGPNRGLAWWDTRVGPITLGGKVVAVTLMNTDITVRKETERKLEALAEEQNLVLSQMRDFLYRHDARGVFTFMSPAVEQITGYSVEQWMTHYTEYLTDNPINQKAIEYTEETLRSGRQSPAYNVEVRHRDGRRILLEVNERAYYENGRVAGVVGVARDVTERRKAEEALRFQKTLLESQSEAAIEGILVVSMEGKMISFNRRFLEMWGIPAEVAESRDDARAIEAVRSQLADHERFGERIRYLYDHPEEQSYDELVLKDGRTFDRYSAPVRSREGILYGRVWFFRDVTGRKRTEQELRRAAHETRRAYEDLKQAQAQLIRSEKLASIGMLVSGVAHEINNPLNVIFGNLQLLADASDDLAPRTGAKRGARRFRNMIRDALKAAQHARRVMDDFRGYARDVRTAEPVDLNGCLEEAVALLQRGFARRIKVVKRLGKIPPVRCFRGQMSQVFLNLLKNAVEAIEKRGTITLRTRHRAGRVVIEIADTGRGMAEDVRAKLFEPFFTTKPVGRGLGLGLSISGMILQNHGGHITVKSRPGRGSTFTLEIPAGRP
jgi:PAS domain S-box-containing protein